MNGIPPIVLPVLSVRTLVTIPRSRRSTISRLRLPSSEVAAEDGPDPLGFLLIDSDLAVLGLISERRHTADPKTFALGGGDLVSDALGGDLSLELGKRQQNIQGQPPHGCRRIELLGDRYERHAMGVEQLHELGKVGQRAGEAIDLVDDDDVDLSGLNVLQQALQRRPLGRAAGIAAIVVARPDQGPSGMGLAPDIGLRGIVLGIQRVEVLLKPVIGRHARVDGAADRFGGPFFTTVPPATA